MPRVLVVDDDPNLLTFVRTALKDEPYEIDTASDGESAIESLLKALPDLLILDVALPGTDGFEVLKTIRKDRNYDALTVIILSADDNPDAKVKGLDLGAVEYLVKPIHPSELAARVRALLRLKKQQDHFHEEYARLSELSLTDPLTGAYNRRALDRLLKARLSESSRYNIPVSIVLFDIDHFKLVNDNHGHATGDRVLREITTLSLSLCREEDALIRYGGEEFLIIIFHTDKEGAHTFAERLRKQVDGYIFNQDKKSFSITLSAGTASYPVDKGIMGVESMIDVADKRLYEAKRAGRNRTVSINAKEA